VHNVSAPVEGGALRRPKS